MSRADPRHGFSWHIRIFTKKKRKEQEKKRRREDEKKRRGEEEKKIEAEKENSGGQGVSSSPAEPITPMKALQNKEEQNRIREAAAAEKERQAAIAERKQEEDEEKNAICNEARLTIDARWTIYDDVPRKGCPPVQRVENNHQVVYVVPTQSYVRGKLEEKVPQLQMKGLEVLEWATDNDILVIGVGHDPMVIPNLIAKLKNSTGVVKKFNWLPPIPLVQPRP